MRTIQVNLYRFNELSAEAKQFTMDRYRYINVEDLGWWESTFEDAANIGVKIDSFSTEQREIGGHLEISIETSIEKVLAEHGKSTLTHEIAEMFKALLPVVTDEVREGIEEKYCNALLKAYLKALDEECDYLMSDEVVSDTLTINEYEFLAEGGKIQ